MGFLEKFLRDTLISMITGNLQKMVESVNTQTADLSGRIAISPSAWEPTVWDMITRIANTAIVPIAAIVLTLVMSIELVKWIEEKNNFHNPSDVIAHLIRFVIKLGIGILLVTKAHDLTMWLFDLAAFALAQAIGIVDISAGAVSVDIAQVTASLQTKRQLLSIVAAGLVCAPLFWLLRGLGQLAFYIAVLPAIPFVLVGFFTAKDGRPLEKVLQNYIEVRYKRPQRRIYQTKNIYAQLALQAQITEVINGESTTIDHAIATEWSD